MVWKDAHIIVTSGTLRQIKWNIWASTSCDIITIFLLSATKFYDYWKTLLKYAFLEMYPANPLDSQDSPAAILLKKVKEVA